MQKCSWSTESQQSEMMKVVNKWVQFAGILYVQDTKP